MRNLNDLRQNQNSNTNSIYKIGPRDKKEKTIKSKGLFKNVYKYFYYKIREQY